MKSIVGRRRISVCLMAALVFACVFSSAALAQQFTLDASAFSPDAVAPSGTASSSIQIGSTTGFSGTVDLSCQVSPSDISITDPPLCLVSPASVSVPATATATITTKSDTTTVQYSITITGTSGSSTVTSSPLPLTVLSVTPQFTITVETTVAPSSVPAGNGAEGAVTVNPINGYVSPDGGVTLACASISPLVTIAPVCTFTYPSGTPSMQVHGMPVSAMLTINTFGPVTTGAHNSRNIFGLWVTLPLIGLVGIGAAASGKRSRKAWGVLALLVLCGTVILVPACGNSTNSTTTPNGITPANTYTFTIVGVDSNGVASSNTSSSSSGPTVSLTVTAPPKTP